MEAPEKIPDHDQLMWLGDRLIGNRLMEDIHGYIHNTDTYIGMHSCDFFELNIVTSGHGYHYFENGTIEVVTGAVFMVPPHTNHGYWTDSKLSVFHALIRSSFFDRYDRELSNMPGYTMLCEIEPYLHNEFSTPITIQLHREVHSEIMEDIGCLIKLDQSKYRGREVMKNARLLFLIGQLSSFVATRWHKPDNSSNDEYSVVIARSMEYIRTHSHNKLMIEDLAEREHMSRSSYVRHFKQISGSTPSNFILECRMAHARKLLCYSDLPIISISLECGFFDSSHLIRLFSQSEGMPPSDYRLMYRKHTDYSQCTLCRKPTA
jgi:AraC-like DNA-binding protein